MRTDLDVLQDILFPSGRVCAATFQRVNGIGWQQTWRCIQRLTDAGFTEGLEIAPIVALSTPPQAEPAPGVLPPYLQRAADIIERAAAALSAEPAPVQAVSTASASRSAESERKDFDAWAESTLDHHSERFVFTMADVNALIRRKCFEAWQARAAIPAAAPAVQPEGWILMPRHLTEAQATYAQGALMDMGWDATICFAARYEELIRCTESARAALAASATPATGAEPVGQVITRSKRGFGGVDVATTKPELYEAYKDLPSGTALYAAPSPSTQPEQKP